MHLGAVMPNVSHSTNLDDQYAEDATGGRLEVSEGSTPVPEGPGLGVEVDERILAELAARPKSELPRHVGILPPARRHHVLHPEHPGGRAADRLCRGQCARRAERGLERRRI